MVARMRVKAAGGWEEPPDSVPLGQKLPRHSTLTPISNEPPEALSILGGHRARGQPWESTNLQDAPPSQP